jgi:hypothetical protein
LDAEEVVHGLADDGVGGGVAGSRVQVTGLTLRSLPVEVRVKTRLALAVPLRTSMLRPVTNSALASASAARMSTPEVRVKSIALTLMTAGVVVRV